MNLSNSQIDRRRFMMLSSACALAPSVMAPSSMAASLEDTREPLAIGYWPGRAAGPFHANDPVHVVSAQSLPTGDGSLTRAGVKVTVHGLIGGVEELATADVRSAALQVHFPVDDVKLADKVKFNAWSVTGGHLPQVSSGLEFQVPTDGGGLDLSLDVDGTATAGERLRRIVLGRSHREFAVHLEVGNELDQPKLREGFYVIPLRQAAFRRPNAVSGLRVESEPCLLLSVKGA